MTFLPIVERELREGSRRAGTYWLRFGFAASAIVVGVFCLFIDNVPVSSRGPVLFWGLAGAAMFFCMFAGRISTADCISREKRAGTLGLLFLTDLKGYDVVLGKLAATSVTGFFGLLAVIPVLAVPLMLGGIGKDEVGRAALVLVNTYFFSLAAGMFASSISRDYRMAMAANFFVFSVLAIFPAVINLLHSGFREPGWFFSCPVYTLFMASDRFYLFSPENFWASLILIHAEGWILVGLSCLIVPRAWRDKPEPSRAGSSTHKPPWRWKELKRWIAYGSADQQPLFRKRALDRNPYYWLAGRARLKPLHLWSAISAYVVWWTYETRKSAAAWGGMDFFFAGFMIFCLMIKLWVAQETVQRLGEDRTSDAFELLLSTPLSVREILEGQWLSLRRQFLAPIVLALIVALAEYLIRAGKPISVVTDFLIVEWLLLPLDVLALIWTGMFGALITRSPTRAVAFAVGRILTLPTVVLILYVCAMNILLVRRRIIGRAWHTPGLWLILSLAADFGFGFYSWWMLRRHFRELAIRPPPFRSRSSPRAL